MDQGIIERIRSASDIVDVIGSYMPLKRAGAKLPVQFIDKAGQPRAIDYAVPNQNQCKTCHQDGEAITPIGPARIAWGLTEGGRDRFYFQIGDRF